MKFLVFIAAAQLVQPVFSDAPDCHTLASCCAGTKDLSSASKSSFSALCSRLLEVIPRTETCAVTKTVTDTTTSTPPALFVTHKSTVTTSGSTVTHTKTALTGGPIVTHFVTSSITATPNVVCTTTTQQELPPINKRRSRGLLQGLGERQDPGQVQIASSLLSNCPGQDPEKTASFCSCLFARRTATETLTATHLATVKAARATSTTTVTVTAAAARHTTTATITNLRTTTRTRTRTRKTTIVDAVCTSTTTITEFVIPPTTTSTTSGDGEASTASTTTTTTDPAESTAPFSPLYHFYNFGGTTEPAVFPNQPDAAHLTVLFNQGGEDSPCQRSRNNETLPYFAGGQYVVATVQNAFIEIGVGNPGSREMVPADGPTANWYYFDSACNPTGPLPLFGQVQLWQPNKFQNPNGPVLFWILDYSPFDLQNFGGTNLQSQQFGTDCGEYDTIPAFTFENCNLAGDV